MVDAKADGTGRVRLSGFLHCASEAEVETIRRHLPEHVRLTLAEPGCISFDVSPTDDPLVWRVEELFVSRAAFEHHQTRTRASAWFAATSTIRRDYQLFDLAQE